MAHARTPLDGGDAEQESQYAAFPSPGMGLEGLKGGCLASLFRCTHSDER